jgi:hypothetical protein
VLIFFFFFPSTPQPKKTPKFFAPTLFGLLLMFIAGHQYSVAVLLRVWAFDKELLQQTMIDVHKKDPALASNMLNVVQELRVFKFCRIRFFFLSAYNAIYW